jgi:hypothetical protein
MLASSAIRSVLTRRFTLRVPPLLVWLKVALAQVTLPLVFSSGVPVAAPSESHGKRGREGIRWMRLR